LSQAAAAQEHPAVLFAPDPGAAQLGRMITAQATLETRTLLRNGEQLLLILIIPLLLLTAFSLEPLINFGTGLPRIDFLTPGIIALAVMSTAFTSQAIATGFERRYGVLKRLGATPLSRGGLIAAKTLTVIGVELHHQPVMRRLDRRRIGTGVETENVIGFLDRHIAAAARRRYVAHRLLALREDWTERRDTRPLRGLDLEPAWTL